MQQRLSLAVWLTVIPVSLGSTALITLQAGRIANRDIERQMLWSAETAAEWFDDWENDHLGAMRFLSKRNAVLGINSENAKQLLEDAHTYVPIYSFYLIDANGLIIREKGPIKKERTLNTLDRIALAQGQATGILVPPNASEPCYYHAVRLTSNNLVSSCIAVKNLGWITGIDTLSKRSAYTNPTTIKDRNSSIPEKSGFGLLLITNRGQALEISDQRISSVFNINNADSAIQKHWAPFMPSGRATGARQTFSQKRVEGKTYFVATAASKDNSETIVLVMDRHIALGPINTIVHAVWIDVLLTFGLITWLIFVVGSNMNRPFEQVRIILGAISQGDFSQRLPIALGEVGQLFKDVNQASIQLEAYLASSKTYAITDAQIKEAQRIQADFLIDELPSSDTVELSASFDPAYQIGADWYDALLMDDVTFVVVADVCDKGIPSALYMSVFRSLMRLGIQRAWTQTNGDAAETLTRMLSYVNEYMAQTHARSAMFATVFIGAYEPQRQRLTHVVAGHEQPLLWHDGQVIQLPSGGPALGLFETATFTTSECPMAAGDMLLAFSDGLTDARNAAGESFGIERVKALMHQLAGADCSAEALRQAMEQAVKAHIGEAEQFDDLTLLTLKPLDPGPGGAS